MKQAYVKIVFMALALSMTVACGKKEDSSVPVNEARGGAGLNPANVPYVNVTSTQAQAQFTNLVKAFLAPTIDPSSVGNVNPSTGLRIGARIVMNGTSGAIDPNSQIQLEVVDDLVNTLDGNKKEYLPIPVTLKGGITADSFARGGDNGTVGNARITFEDEFGTVRIEGTYRNSGGSFTGTVLFSNKDGVSFAGISSGTLGTFVIPTCSFFLCN